MSIEAMKQALRVFDAPILADEHEQAMRRRKACDALRQAIEQAEKLKPTLWLGIGGDGRVKYTTDSDRALKWKQAGSYRLVRDYYTSPVHASDISQERVDETAKREHEWVGLTDEEVGGLTVFDGLTHIEVPILADFVRAIEAKLKEKNT